MKKYVHYFLQTIHDNPAPNPRASVWIKVNGKSQTSSRGCINLLTLTLTVFLRERFPIRPS